MIIPDRQARGMLAQAKPIGNTVRKLRETTETYVSTPASIRRRPAVCALIVTFNPGPSFEENIRALRPQVDLIIIIDNHSSDAHRSRIAQIASGYSSEVIWNSRNEGIAAALNAGIRHALAKGEHCWIATFDQDSRVSPTFIDAMLQAYESCPFQKLVALIGPHYISDVGRSPGERDYATTADCFREVKTTMTSGNLVNPRIFEACGMFDESFFIDYVDHEFCLRLRRHGFRIIEAVSALLLHSHGLRTEHRIFNRNVVATNYAPVRRYYNARNRVRVYRKYCATEPWWVTKDIFGLFKEILKLLVFEQNRGEKLTNIVLGAWDGFKGKGGVRPERSTSSPESRHAP